MAGTTGKELKKDVVYGRPRLLTHDEIIRGALDLGLEGLTMKRLADHLNVGTATLYQYWSNRKELMRAAAVHALSDLDLPEDNGQHWAQYAHEFALCIEHHLAANSSIILANHVREYGFPVQFKLAEQFLSVMHDRGFTPDVGMQIFNIVGLAAFAGAVEEVRQNDFEAQHEDPKEIAQRQFAQLDSSEFPLFSQAMSRLTTPPGERMQALLQAAFRTIARDHGEDEKLVLLNGS